MRQAPRQAMTRATDPAPKCGLRCTAVNKSHEAEAGCEQDARSRGRVSELVNPGDRTSVQLLFEAPIELHRFSMPNAHCERRGESRGSNPDTLQHWILRAITWHLGRVAVTGLSHVTFAMV
jgi:hypothetical protein